MRYSNAICKKHSESECKPELKVIKKKEVINDQQTRQQIRRGEDLQSANAQLTRDNQILHSMINALKVDIKKYKQNYKSLEIMIKKLKSRTFELESKPETPESEEDFEQIKNSIIKNEQKIETLRKKKHQKKKKVPGFERLYNLSKKKSLKRRE